MATVKIGNRSVGDGENVYVIAEIGINHNGSLKKALRLIKGAREAGCDCVKFQKRTPELCVPKDQWNIERDTPWGRITYIDYRHRVELSFSDYQQIDDYCRKKKIDWTASCWDEESVDFIDQFDVPFYKAASASLTDISLLKKKRSTGKPLMISTGMSTMEEIEAAVSAIGTDDLLIAHSTSTYPCKPEELNLRVIQTLKGRFPEVPIGYSGHEVGLSTTLAAVTLGAVFVERHITLDRAMWGTDQAASVELGGFRKLVEDIRDVEKSLGDGIKRVFESELGPRKKLRRV
ncbi:MAG: N-acetylneuraminate synthase family protein [Ignavibacteria bacterium]|nr:N-acetylneuraminate synthase family protein [Ignavibacteria bacterium]